MKKTLAAIVALALCLSLCACSGVQQEVYDAAKAGYDELSSKYDVLKSKFEKYSTVIEALEKEDYDGAIAAVEAMRPAPEKRPSHEVVITMDNWEEYFEIVEIPKATAFGEMDRLTYVFKLREQYKELLDYDSFFRIDISYIITVKGNSYFDYDYSTNTLTLTGWQNQYSYNDTSKETCSFDNSTLKSENEVDPNDFTAFHPCTINIGHVNNNKVCVLEISIDNIKGSIYLYD